MHHRQEVTPQQLTALHPQWHGRRWHAAAGVNGLVGTQSTASSDQQQGGTPWHALPRSSQHNTVHMNMPVRHKHVVCVCVGRRRRGRHQHRHQQLCRSGSQADSTRQPSLARALFPRDVIPHTLPHTPTTAHTRSSTTTGPTARPSRSWRSTPRCCGGQACTTKTPMQPVT